MAEESCPKCGMGKNVWKGGGGQGVTHEGTTYCCSGCADGSGCTC